MALMKLKSARTWCRSLAPDQFSTQIQSVALAVADLAPHKNYSMKTQHAFRFPIPRRKRACQIVGSCAEKY